MKTILRLSFAMIALSSLACQTLDEGESGERVGSQGKSEQVLLAKLELIESQLNDAHPDIALRALMPLMEETPQDSRVMTLAGLAYLALGISDQALSLLSKVYAMGPDAKGALNLSSVFLSLGRSKEARDVVLKHLGQSEEVYKNKERLYHNLALSYEQEQRWTSAIKYYKKAISVAPTYYHSLYRLGLAQKAKGLGKDAYASFEKARRVCPLCLPPVKELSLMLHARGKSGDARKLVDTYVAQKEVGERDRKEADHMRRTFQAENK